MATIYGRLHFEAAGEAGLRQWVETNPGRVNDRNSRGYKSAPLVLWLVKEKRADVNDMYARGTLLFTLQTPLTSLMLSWTVARIPPCWIRTV